MHKQSPAEQRSVNQRCSRPLLFGFLCILLALAFACSRAPEDSAVTIANTDPDQLLRQMSEKLAQAKNLSFKVDRKLDAALIEGRNIADNAEVEISVSRPGKFQAKSHSKDNTREVFFDGVGLSSFPVCAITLLAAFTTGRKYTAAARSMSVSTSNNWSSGSFSACSFLARK